MCPMAPFCTANRATSYSSVQAITGHFLVTLESACNNMQKIVSSCVGQMRL